MSYPINTGIPNANNYPGDDQPGMQTNFSNINSYLGIDHVLPGLSGNGEHKQVTFNANNVPTPPVSPAILFTNNQDGAGNALPGSVSELFYYSGTSAQSKNQYVSTANGSVLLMGGIILKWGKSSGSANNTPVTFGVAFPNNCFAVYASGGLASGTQPTINVNPATLSVSGFVLKITGTTPVDVFYLAIGN